MNLKDTIFSKKRAWNCIESTYIGGIIIPYVLINKYQLYIYGCGQDIDSYIQFIQSNGVDCAGIIDKNVEKDGVIICGVRCRSLNSVPLAENQDNTFVIITTSYYDGLQHSEIVKSLGMRGFNQYYFLTPSERMIIVGSNWGELYHGRIRFFRENYKELENTFSILKDERSRKIMNEYIRIHVECDNWKLTQIDGRYKYFFDEDRVPIYVHKKDEVWINCGSGIGDSIFLYYANRLEAKRIYAYEPDEAMFGKLTYNINQLNEKYRSHITLVNEGIKEGFVFRGQKDEKVTLINADIEGSELMLVQSLESVILKDRPVVAVCLYHKKDDLVTIPRYFREHFNDYVFILRKYAGGFNEDRQFTELVGYFVPIERCCSLECFE